MNLVSSISSANLAQRNLPNKCSVKKSEKKSKKLQGGHFHGLKIPNEIVFSLFSAKKLHALALYSEITRNPSFSGHLKETRIAEMCAIMGRSRKTIMRQLAALEENGLVERHDGLWMAVGGAKFVARCGRFRVISSVVPENTSVTTFAYTVVTSAQAHWKNWNDRKTSPKTTQDYDDGLKAVAMSASYQEVHMAANLGISRSSSSIRRHRGLALGAGIINYQRTRNVVKKGGRRMTGGFEIECEFRNAMACDQLSSGEYLRQRRGTSSWIEEVSPVFGSVLHFSSKGISTSLKKVAGNAKRSRQR